MGRRECRVPFPGLYYLVRPIELLLYLVQCHLWNLFPSLITVTALKVTTLRQMPLDEETKLFYCQTGNHVVFQLFHLRHRLPGMAVRIISQNFASCRLACSFRKTLFFAFNLLTSFPVNWPGSKWTAAS